MNILVKNLRRIREIKGYSQEYMAAKMDISQSAYCKIESGKQKLRVERLLRLSEILEVAAENLLFSAEDINLINCQKFQAVSTINDNSAFNNIMKDELINYLKEENERLIGQNNSLIEMLKKHLF